MSIDELRFAGVARLYGREGAERLAAAHVAVVGIGGVGSWVAEALARSGVGEISLFDLDDVCISNSNRQIQALTDTVGRAKVEVMAERIRAINPACVVHAVADFVTRETMAEYITPRARLRGRLHRQRGGQGGADLLVQAAQDPHHRHRRCWRSAGPDADPSGGPEQGVQ